MRVYEMFMGPLEASKPWATAGLVGVEPLPREGLGPRPEGHRRSRADRRPAAGPAQDRKEGQPATPRTLNFNTAISAMMIYVNELGKLESAAPRCSGSPSSSCSRPTRPTSPRSSGSAPATREASVRESLAELRRGPLRGRHQGDRRPGERQDARALQAAAGTAEDELRERGPRPAQGPGMDPGQEDRQSDRRQGEAGQYRRRRLGPDPPPGFTGSR